MGTAVIEIQNNVANSFLYQLERMNVLRIVNNQRTQNVNGQKLSERFLGALPKERAGELHEELKKMREEWERDIY